jgi:hypothetical protein
VTKEVSKSSIPRIHEVIPFMDGLFDTLDDYAGDNNRAPAVRMAAKRGLTVLKKYYGKTDESSIFRIAMSLCDFRYDFIFTNVSLVLVLHPAYKTEYFRTHKWPEEWITAALSLLRADWVKSYKDAGTDLDPTANMARSSKDQVCIYLSIC